MEEEIREFQEYFSTMMQKPILDLVASYPKSKSLVVDVTQFSRFNYELANAVMDKPDHYTKAAEEALTKSVETFGLLPEGFKPKVRFSNLPQKEILVQYLGADHLNKLVQVQGVVDLITDIRPKLQVALWECAFCERTTKNFPDKSGLKPPTLCGNCGKKEFVLLEASSDFVNTQYGQLQDLLERVQGSSTPAHVDLWFEEDLTNVVMPGETVTLTGILRLMPRVEKNKAKSSVYAKAFDVVFVKKEEKEFEEIEISKEEEQKILELSQSPRLREIITESVAPSIWGHTEVKQSIALQLFGGTPDKVLPDGNRVRSDIHVLLIGDPGTAKSQLLKYTELLAPKCIYVAGRGASGVGLTASAEKDKAGEGWVLKAGALVLASGGLVAIDEFDKMEKEDRANIHEAMEQQQISIAKAGIVTKFKAKTSILAAANPKYGRFDTNEPIVAQFEIPPTLLSRFDLIFTIRDTLDESEDRKKATHILKGLRYAAEKRAGNAPEQETQPNISNDLLRKYIAYARRTTVPQLNDQAMERIKDYYVELRAMGAKTQTFPVTPRDLEGLVRLSEAAAKMRLSNKVELQDAEYAISLKDFVLNLVFIDKSTGRIDADVIQTGISKSKRDKIFSVLHLVQELEKEYDLVEVGEVVRKAVPTGLDEAEILKILDELKTKGDLYSPKPGFVKTAYKKYG